MEDSHRVTRFRSRQGSEEMGGEKDPPPRGSKRHRSSSKSVSRSQDVGAAPPKLSPPHPPPFSPSPLCLLRSSSLPSLPHLLPSLTAPPILFPRFATLLDSTSKGAVSDPELGGSWGRNMTRPLSAFSNSLHAAPSARPAQIPVPSFSLAQSTPQTPPVWCQLRGG